MKPSNFSVWIMTLAILGLLMGCGEGWQGCPDGTFPEDGVCKTGCPDGTINQNGKCVPHSSDEPPVVEDGDDDVDDAEADTEDSEGDAEDFDPSGLGLNWVQIRGGNFQMGCVDHDDICNEDKRPIENPRHTVSIQPFKMIQYEVTNLQYVEFLNANADDCEENTCHHFTFIENNLELVDGVWSVIPGFESYPEKGASWYGANAFCEWAGGRLPSEAEWEYAARGGTTSIYVCGDIESCLHEVAWHAYNSEGTEAVGQLERNNFGLYDMFGNVMEWTEDCYHEETYIGAPDDGSVWEGGDCSSHMIRGGSVESGSRVDMRSSSRAFIRGSNSGVRCVY